MQPKYLFTQYLKPPIYLKMSLISKKKRKNLSYLPARKEFNDAYVVLYLSH